MSTLSNGYNCCVGRHVSVGDRCYWPPCWLCQPFSRGKTKLISSTHKFSLSLVFLTLNPTFTFSYGVFLISWKLILFNPQSWPTDLTQSHISPLKMSFRTYPPSELSSAVYLNNVMVYGAGRRDPLNKIWNQHII